MTTRSLSISKPAQIFMVCLLLSGCSKPESMAKYVLVGAAAGAGVGAVAMVATGGCIGCGLAVSGAVGAAMGAAFNILDNKR